jgi:hypothetical protein
LPIAGWTFHACCLGPHFDGLNPNIRCLNSYFLLINPFQLLVISWYFMRSPKFAAWSYHFCRLIQPIWVCLKIVYPYTQWWMIIIPTKWRFHWGYTSFSDIPMWFMVKAPSLTMLHGSLWSPKNGSWIHRLRFGPGKGRQLIRCPEGLACQVKPLWKALWCLTCTLW